jgi:TPR repeat protein
MPVQSEFLDTLDESAMEAVSKWRFRPATKDGNPVSIHATVDVTFHLRGEYFDAKAERDRTRFNAVASHLKKDGSPSDADIKDMRELVKDKLPAAEYVLGIWEVHGTAVPQDVTDGLAHIQRAADKNYGPAMFFIGDAKYRGTLLPKDTETGLKMIHDSAVLGDIESQYMLGQMYENGIGVAMDREKAKRYYRLCAAKARPACEFRLGQLLLALDGSQEWKRLEATAWLELAHPYV